MSISFTKVLGVLPAVVWTKDTAKAVSAFGPIIVAPVGADLTGPLGSVKWWWVSWGVLGIGSVAAHALWNVAIPGVVVVFGGAVAATAIVKGWKELWKKVKPKA